MNPLELLKKIFTLSFLITLVLSCKNNAPNNARLLPVIDIENNINSFETVNLSTIANDIEYIALETNENCLIGEIRNLIITKDRIFVIGLNSCRIFSRHGKFIGNAGSIGGGPGQYSSIGSASVDENNRRLFLFANFNEIFEFSFEGEFIRNIDFSNILNVSDKIDLSDPANGFSIQDCLFYSDSIFCCTRQRLKGNEPFTVIFFNSRSILKSVPNQYIHNKKERNGPIIIFDDIKISWTDRFNIYDQISDTVFLIKRNFDLTPSFCFHFGKFKRPIEAFEDISINPGRYIKASHIIETKGTIFFLCAFGKNFPASEKKLSSTVYSSGNYRNINRSVSYGFYNKQTNKLVFLRSIKGRSGFENDIDGGMPFAPEYMAFNEQMVCVLNPEGLKDWVETEEFRKSDPLYPEKKKELQGLIKTVQNTDNPVLMIVKLKY